MKYNISTINTLNFKNKEFILESTFDYNRFRFLKGNRQLNKSNLLKIELSIKKYGLLQPIIVTSRGYIMDGQHRFEVLKKLNKQIHYIISKSADRFMVLESNNSRRGWSLMDYINFYSNENNFNYVTLKTIIEKWSDIASLSSIISSYSKVSDAHTIKTGNYKVDVSFGNSIMSDCLLMKEVTDVSFHAKFIIAIRKIKLENKNFQIKQLIKNAKRKKIRVYTNFTDTYDNIIEVYNYNLSEKNRI